MTGRSLLALGGGASRTGVPRLLASLLHELTSTGELDPSRVRVLLRTGGPLEDDLGRTASVRVLGPTASLAGPLAARVHPRARPLGDWVGLNAGLVTRPARSDPGPPDLVWANGADAARMAAVLPRAARRAPLVVHVHELAIGLRRSLAGSSPHHLLDRADVVVAVSDAVRAHLEDDVGLSPDRVAVHRGWVPGLGPAPIERVDPRRPAPVPAGALLVGSCGSIGWRKGTDLFLDLARHLPESIDGRPVHLVWVGGPARAGDDGRAAREVALRGLDHRVHLVGEVPDAAPWLAGLDLLVHPAREDPFPLAVLEAGARAVPVVGFRSGGIVEALPEADHDACLADLFDGDGLADRVRALLVDATARSAIGTRLAHRISEHHAERPAVAALWRDVGERLGWS